MYYVRWCKKGGKPNRDESDANNDEHRNYLRERESQQALREKMVF